MDWQAWFGLTPRRRWEALAAGGRAWRWRASESGRRLGSFGRGAPRWALPSFEELRHTAEDVGARWQAYQTQHPYQALAGNLLAGVMLGLILGRWAARTKE